VASAQDLSSFEIHWVSRLDLHSTYFQALMATRLDRNQRPVAEAWAQNGISKGRAPRSEKPPPIIATAE